MANSNLLLKIPAMTIGAAGAVLSAYSIVKDGNAKARRETKDELGEKYVDMYVKNLSSSRESHLLEKVKRFVLKQKFDNSFYPFLLQAKNHVVNWVSETAENIIPIILSAIAIGAPKIIKNKKISTYTSAASAGLLVLGAGKFFIHDVLGVGKNKEY
ncbi:MAG TPA: hypothetical protein DDW90_05495 [Cyanobacteria bacterium UBA9971]|nr:hypothetical protein [Cyanobacteria bacterium UBA9971]